MDNHHPEPGHRLADWVQRTLLTGLAISGGLLAAGLILTLSGRQGRAGASGPASTILAEAARGRSAGLLDLGLLALMATPIARVAVLALGWGLERQWRFLAVALAVLALLGVGLALGMG